MDTNKVADSILTLLRTEHARSYWNTVPTKPVYPYINFMMQSATPTDPSIDYYLHIDIYENTNTSTIAMEALADKIHKAFDNKIILTDDINAHTVLEDRQFISNTDLITAQMINLRFVMRTYFKG